jgi:hypothetical protein
MSDIPRELVDKMMVKCGRRCCICRRFRPTKLQVHHIEEKGQGGGSDEDNLIVTCFSCHSDVHTVVPFARRFTQPELKRHRETLIQQVENGVLPAEDNDDTDEAIRRIVRELQASKSTTVQILPEAGEVLLAAVKEGGDGTILEVRNFEGYGVIVSGRPIIQEHLTPEQVENSRTDPVVQRLIAKYKHALEQLRRFGLIEEHSGNVHDVTYQGYLIADELAARGSKAVSE